MLTSARTMRQILSLAGVGAFALLALLVLTNCGASTGAASFPTSTPIVRTTPSGVASTPTGSLPTSTPLPATTPTSTTSTPTYAYLYSVVDYPLQIPVGSSDVVNLTLSINRNILTVTPVAGQGQTPAVAPIALPTDLQDYQEIDVSAATTTDGISPIVWQETSALNQALLPPETAGVARQYADQLLFKWHVQATAAGQNLTRLVLQLTYVYLDGSEHTGTAEVAQAPIPMVAVQPTAANTWLPQIKVPVIGLSGLVGLWGVIQFLWNLYQTGQQAAEAAKKARAVLTRRGGNASAP